jgi:hypothetical protein
MSSAIQYEYYVYDGSEYELKDIIAARIVVDAFIKSGDIVPGDTLYRELEGAYE